MADEKLKTVPPSSEGPDTGAPPTPPPLDPFTRVTAAIDEFGRASGMDPKDLQRLHTLITAAVDERATEVQDVRIGRVLGSALATL